MSIVGYEAAYETAKAITEGLEKVEFDENFKLKSSDDGRLMFNGVELDRSGMMSLARVMNVPGAMRYLDHCPSDVAATNLNYWVREKELQKEYLAVRQGNRVFLFLSKAIRALEDTKLLEVVNEALSGTSFCAVVSEKHQSFGLAHSHFSVYFAAKGKDASRDDFLYPGLHFYNSQIGVEPLQVHGYVHRQVCENGLIAPVDFIKESFSNIHDAEAGLSEFIRGLLPKLEAEVDRVIGLQEIEVEDPHTALLSMTEHVGFSDSQRARLADRVTGDSPILTMYDVVNHVTAFANDISPNAARRAQLRAGHMVWAARDSKVCSSCHSVLFSRDGDGHGSVGASSEAGESADHN